MSHAASQEKSKEPHNSAPPIDAGEEAIPRRTSHVESESDSSFKQVLDNLLHSIEGSSQSSRKLDHAVLDGGDKPKPAPEEKSRAAPASLEFLREFEEYDECQRKLSIAEADVDKKNDDVSCCGLGPAAGRLCVLL